MKESQRIFKNVIAGGLGTTIGGGLQFAAVLLLARGLGVAEFGMYCLLATSAFMLNRFADLGTSAILVRDLAVNPGNMRNLLSSALSLAWFIVLCGSATIAIGAHFVSATSRIEGPLVIMGVAGLLQFPCACYGAAMRAREENELEIVGFFLHKLLLLLLVWTALALGSGLRGVAIAYLFAACSQWYVCRSIVLRRYVRPLWRFNLSEWRYLLKESVPFGISAAVRLMGEQADVVILAWMAGISAVGLYSGVFRITMGFRFVSQAMIIGLFPMYSRAASRFDNTSVDPTSEFQRIYEFGVRVFTLMGVPFAATLLVASRPLVTLLLGPGYLPALPVLRVLALAAGIFFIGSPFPYLLTALNDQRFLLTSSIWAVVVRLVLLITLVGPFGIIGAAWAVLASETVLLCIWLFHFAGKSFVLAPGPMLSKIALASLAMGPVLYFGSLQKLAPLLAGLALSGALYVLTLLKLRIFSEQEIRLAAEGLTFIKPLLGEWSHQTRSE